MYSFFKKNMIIYSQHYFRKRHRKIPSPSCLPLTILFAILCMCVIVVMPPIITGVKIDMPQLNTQPLEIFDDFKYVTVNITDKGTIIINGNQIQPNEIADTIKLTHNNVPLEDIKIFVKAYKGIDYNSMINLLQLMNDNGLTDITLVGNYTGGIQ